MPQRGTVGLAGWCLSKPIRSQYDSSLNASATKNSSRIVTFAAPHRDASIRCLTTHMQTLHSLNWCSRGVSTDAQPMPVLALVLGWLGPCGTASHFLLGIDA
ncbi:Uncharacterized protein HZ326_8606 [Fusarium oxysporum f. sp. albedinis]|nr:Uncharacterized protein HZ326_8606 [Fusarium oxysporum f. sp. albedinis]